MIIHVARLIVIDTKQRMIIVRELINSVIFIFFLIYQLGAELMRNYPIDSSY